MKFILGLLTGAVIGAVGAVAYSMQTGRDLRDALDDVRADLSSRDLDALGARLEARFNEMQAQVESRIGQVRERAEAAAGNAGEAVDAAVEDTTQAAEAAQEAGEDAAGASTVASTFSSPASAAGAAAGSVRAGTDPLRASLCACLPLKRASRRDPRASRSRLLRSARTSSSASRRSRPVCIE
jgi:gas vesicle protein